MIITDNLPPKSPTSTTVSSPVQRVEFGSSANPPPPAYNAESESSPLLEGSSRAVESTPPKPTETAERRFLKAFAVAMLIYLAVGGLFVSVNINYEFRPPFSWGSAPSPPRDDADLTNCALTWSEEQVLTPATAIPKSKSTEDGLIVILPMVPGASSPVTASENNDERIDPLTSEAKPPYSSKTSFELPASAPLLYFLARGSLASGRITYDVGDIPDNKVKVDVERRYWSHEARDRANVCVLSKDEGAAGLGIYTPKGWPHHPDTTDRVIFDIKVTLPGKISQLKRLNSLHAFMPLFRQTFGDLESRVTFESVDIRTSNSGISTESLTASYVKLISSNASITGKFNVTEALSLHTSDGKIDIQAQMLNEDRHIPTWLKMETSNARISALVNVHSTREYASNGNGGYFKVDAVTSNGALDLRIPTAPSLSHTTLSASTSNASARVKLPIEYEGTISAATSNSPVVLNINTAADDPTGHNLERHFQVNDYSNTKTNAAVWWGDHSEHRDLGSARIVTSNGRCVVEG